MNNQVSVLQPVTFSKEYGLFYICFTNPGREARSCLLRVSVQTFGKLVLYFSKAARHRVKQPGKGGTMKTKIPGTPVKLALGLLVTLTLLAADSRRRESSAGQPAMNSGEKMMLAEKQVYHTGTVPPIDAEAPAEFETATFGLG